MSGRNARCSASSISTAAVVETVEPIPLSDRLQAVIKERSRPLALRFDRQLRLLDYQGRPDLLALGGVEIGDSLESLLPVLSGLPLDEPLDLAFIELADKRAYHCALRPAPPAGCDLILLDAEQERQSQQELQQISNEVRLLDHRNQQLLAELKASNRELLARRREAEQASLLKGRFIASMSHEFRTPLTAILGHTQLLLTEPSGPKQLSPLHAIERSGHYLLSLIDNLMDHARLEQGKVEITPRPTALKELITELEGLFQGMAERKGLRFMVELKLPPEEVMVDPLRLRQVLINLIGNAIKFTVRGQVRVEGGWQGGRLAIAITDTGPGIGAADQEKIFFAFQRLEGGRQPGAGLGLAITRQLLRAMEGDLTLNSALDEGSRFELLLPAPLATPPLQPSPSEATRVVKPGRSTRAYRVLLAEDNPDIVDLVQMLFDQNGYQLTIARDGQRAVHAVAEKAPDLVLLDLNMPVMNGYQATQRIRADGYRGPLIILSATTSAEEKRRASAAGCDGFIEKPFVISELMSAVRRYIEIGVERADDA